MTRTRSLIALLSIVALPLGAQSIPRPQPPVSMPAPSQPPLQTPTSAPEPATMVLLASGLVAIGVAARRFRK